MKSLKLRENFYWVGVEDPDLRVFDIIMYTEFGTTYNSYVLKAQDKTILFETAKAKYFDDFRKSRILPPSTTWWSATRSRITPAAWSGSWI